MGIMNIIKGQLIDVIEFRTDDKSILAHRFDDNGKQIMMGAQLTVRPSQAAVFVNEGQIADIYKEGRYELTTSNMPVLTLLRSWKHGFESPFKVDIYFIALDDKIQQPWGTPSKIAIKDPDFGMLRIGSNGYYSYKVSNPEMFLKKLVATDEEFIVDECRPHLNGKLTNIFTDFFAQSKVTLFEAYDKMIDFSTAIKEAAMPAFEEFGLYLNDFILQELKIPDVVEQAMDQRASIGALGGMDMYQRKIMVDSMGQAAVKMAENEGGGGGVGPMGMQMGAGVAMGGMMSQMMQGSMMGSNLNQPQSQQPTQVAMGTCSKCNAHVASGAKFCPECGTKQEVAKAFCKECGVEIQKGIKFCPECGKAQ